MCLAGPATLAAGPVCAVLHVMLTRRRRVFTPLCPDHASYWVVRAWLMQGGTSAVFCSLVGTLVAGDRLPGQVANWWDVILLVWLAVAAAWVVAMLILSQLSIRPCYVGDTIELLGVHAAFDGALARWRFDQPQLEAPRDDTDGRWRGGA
jgi:hypothetical protein